MAGALASRTLARPSFETAFAAPTFARAMLAFESALAAGEAEEGLIPEEAARAIGSACESIAIDEEKLVAEGKRSATLAVPLVDMLRAEVGRQSGDAVAMSLRRDEQDADTAMALCLLCLEEADRSLEGAVRGLAAKARGHAATPMLGRTLMQPALPITAGFKIARWALALAHDRERLADAQAAGLAVQLGGPAGTLDALGSKAPAVRHRVAMRLVRGCAQLARASQCVDRPARSHRPVVATAGKIARHLAPRSRRVARCSSTSPGGRGPVELDATWQPVGCVTPRRLRSACRGLLATVRAAAISENERALGGGGRRSSVVPGDRIGWAPASISSTASRPRWSSMQDG
jgi:3-carboxy-cis,cis-muconate cycloisomerase